MPVVYRCRGCGQVLYVFYPSDGLSPPAPSDVSALYAGVCPRCGRRLGQPSVDGVRVLGPLPVCLEPLEPTRHVSVSYKGCRVPSSALKRAIPLVLAGEVGGARCPSRVCTVKVTSILRDILRRAAEERHTTISRLLSEASGIAVGWRG